MATRKKQSVPLPATGIDWASPVGDFMPAAADEPAAQEQDQPSGMMRRAGDVGLSLLKGAIGVPESIVGMADVFSGGRAGKVLENEGGAVGFRPKEAKAVIDSWMSPEAQAAQRELQQAQGVGESIGAVVRNPSLVVNAAAESLPVMGLGGVVGRGALAVAPRMSGAAAGAIGEGLTTVGSQAEGIRQETADGLLTGQQSAIAGGSGLLTGVFSVIGNKVAQRLGIADVDAILAGKAGPVVQKGFTRRVLEGAVSEGLLEELPQSIQEQVATNLALGKPLDDGVAQAAVLGAMTGGLMGGGVNVFHRPGDEVRAQKVPEGGPMTKAANAGLEAQAQAMDAAGPPPAPPAPEIADALLAHANQRARELEEKAKGTKDETVTGADGEKIVFPGVQPQFLTPDEKAERDFLKEHGGDATMLAQAYTVAMPEPAAEQPPEAAPVVDEAAARAQREADRPAAPEGQPQAGDILNREGQPFTTMRAAMSAQQRAGDGYELAPVAGGLVVRPKSAALPQATTNPQPTTLGTTIEGRPGNAPGFDAASVAPKPAPPQPEGNPASVAELPAAPAQAQEQSPAVDGEKWWDKELTPHGRRLVMQHAGVKRPDRVLWRHLPDDIKAKLLASRSAAEIERAPEQRTDVQEQAPAPVPEAAAPRAEQEGPDRAGAAAAEAPARTGAGVDEAGAAAAEGGLVAADWWNRASPEVREAAVVAAGYGKDGKPSMVGQRIAGRPWADVVPAARAKLATVYAQQPEVGSQTAPKAGAPAAVEAPEAAPAADQPPAATNPDSPRERARDPKVVALRKELSVLKSLLECIG